MECPCGSKKNYDICCGPYHTGEKVPATPEELMRSRYSAYALKKFDYIEATMGEKALEQYNPTEAKQLAEYTDWLGLQVLFCDEREDEGTVHFIAYYRVKGVKRGMHEISQFKKMNQKWYYVDGQVTFLED